MTSRTNSGLGHAPHGGPDLVVGIALAVLAGGALTLAWARLSGRRSGH